MKGVKTKVLSIATREEAPVSSEGKETEMKGKNGKNLENENRLLI